MKRLFSQVSFFVLAALVFGVGRNAIAPGGTDWVGDWAQRDSLIAAAATDSTAVPASAEEGDPPFLTLPEAVSLYGQPDVVFLDAREPEEYDAGHIAGAILLPFDHFDEYWPQVETRITPAQRIVTYCSGAECELSLFLARHLRTLGYNDVSVFFGGWGLWSDSGHPVEAAGDPAAGS